MQMKHLTASFEILANTANYHESEHTNEMIKNKTNYKTRFINKYPPHEAYVKFL